MMSQSQRCLGAVIPNGRYLPRKPYVIVEKDVTMVTIPEIGYPDHGTAVLGQLSALDEARDWGEAKRKASPALFPKPNHTSSHLYLVKMATERS